MSHSLRGATLIGSAAIATVAACAAYGPAPLRLQPVTGLDLYVPVPADNPLTEAGVVLGERLFFDARLSRDSSRSCASCHQPERAFTDGVARSVGVAGRITRRNTPTLHNRAWAPALTWDGRAATLELQVLRPIEDPDEMDLPHAELLRRVRADPGYVRAFRHAYRDGVSHDNIARALASYIRTLRSADSPFDRFRAGDTLALSAAARRGFRLFAGRAACTICHTGPDLSDGEFHNTGVAWRTGGVSDPGRFGVTGDSAQLGAFRTPMLRDVTLTAPYMHDGSIASLEDVVDFYDRGGASNPHLDSAVRPLGLSAGERRDLLAFLHSLTGARVRVPYP